MKSPLIEFLAEWLEEEKKAGTPTDDGGNPHA